ncbi:MAG TPA: DUF1697 domain-containing protein [Blastocatellia bacterium]|nr:DUF1697 domain-containing protein [Blastocatellia bacterium]
MPRFIAFLRAINVGGHNVKMETLRALFVELGFTNVETFIASGNVIFETNARNSKLLEEQIAAHLKASLGYEVATFVRTDAEVQAVANYQPFPAAAITTAMALNVGFLAAPLSREAADKLLSYRNEMDDLHLHGREVYWLCRMKQTESPFAKAGFEKIVKTKATFRGVNTVRKLAAKYPTKNKEERQ